MSNLEINPHFVFDDIKSQDLKQDNYIDPYHYLRRPIEPERLKLIYQQAFIYDLLYKFAKQYLPDVKDVNEKPQIICQNEKTTTETTDTTIDSIRDKVIEYLFKNQVNVNDKEKDELKIEEKNRLLDNIWDTDDLNILRKNFSQIKEDNMHLKSEIYVLAEENIELKDKLEKLKSETKHMPDEIKTLEKTNERLYIRVIDLEKRFINYKKELENFDKTIDKMKEDELNLKNKIQNLTSEKLKLEFELNKCNLKLKTNQNELKSFFMEKCEKYKLKYLKEIQELNKKLNEIQTNYNQEKTDNEKCKKALENLRTHFMHSLIQNDTKNKIDDSQIKLF